MKKVAQVLFLLLDCYYLYIQGIAQISLPKKLFTPLKNGDQLMVYWQMGYGAVENAHVYGYQVNAVV